MNCIQHPRACQTLMTDEYRLLMEWYLAGKDQSARGKICSHGLFVHPQDLTEKIYCA